MSQQENNAMHKHFYRASAADFKKIPGSPIIYDACQSVYSSFEDYLPLIKEHHACSGLQTGNNDFFLKQWYEVNQLGILSEECNLEIRNQFKWYFHRKGGEFRKWYGNIDYILRWENDGADIKSSKSARPQNLDKWFSSGVTWSHTSSSSFSARLLRTIDTINVEGPSAFSHQPYKLLGYLSSKVAFHLMGILNPTLHFLVGTVSQLPYQLDKGDLDISLKLVELAKNDWDSYEISWDFSSIHLLAFANPESTLKATCKKLRSRWQDTTLEMQRLEEENNRLFIDAYGLQDELTPDVPLSEITLTCNPHYRYGGNLTDEEREARLQSDTIAELISYAIGCMMGRYSLDREGLVYAHAGNEGFKALVEEGAYSTFAADDDGILPLTSENWFADDVAARIEQFVATVWGKDQLEENLNFIAESLNLYAIKSVKKGGETARETIRRYLSTQFYKDHLKTYKKRPIYWLFSSGKEKAFECLVYLHRYNESTLPRMRTEYVTPLLGQMASRIERKRMEQTEASTAEAKRIAKEIDSLTKQLSELRAFDDQLKHHADMRIRLDLDDGVKVNYGKFGTLLSDVKAITGDKGD
ncbi:BREX-1 system adenine-specific DNA-methyltransferase PglX [Shewanella baltica]|uniref:BREX-1 system adenine-specific DNA-methyltransferase PglX n=1 Tax=Shewanella baltica TaxID=62322 RepID=UPI00217CC65C|nr:BREX-1 system adenine-specific DNA-methyltransferase PglX [Shewanella baltica]MCS6174110.1 BREX-1 system adenine-specific DNA-methyltransferase PglX [Shewanella baltica]